MPVKMLNRVRQPSCLLPALIMVCLVMAGCGIARNRPPLEKNGMKYGITDGAFRHRYWNYYERGISYSEGKFWNEAEIDFREALMKRGKDQLRSRTYGLHFIEYFPQRELGIALFHQKKYEESIQELEKSLENEPSSRGMFFLDASRKAMLLSRNLDKKPPEIIVTTPVEKAIVKRNKMIVSGIARDDSFVKEVRINNYAVPIDLSKPEITFTKEIPLSPGDNRITVVATDLTGKAATLERTVRCDRSGPVLCLSEPIPSKTKENTWFIKAYAGDNDALRKIFMNGKCIMETTVSEAIINCPVILSAGMEKVVLSAEDRAGNRTRAEILPGAPLSKSGIDTPPIIRLASLTVPPQLLTSTAAPSSSSDNLKTGSGISIDRGGAVTFSPPPSEPGMGNNYALIIGINAYTTWAPLKTAVNDAKKLKQILAQRYAFHEKNIQLITDKDATRVNLISALMQITSRLGESDNLLIYFAGHGQLNEHANDGYWIPVEGKRGNAVWSWIAHSAVKNIIISEDVRANNIVVIADSCYGGKLARGGALSETVSQTKLLQLCTRKSRQIISSGSLEPVADWGRENHSLFAYYLLKGLRDNTRTAIDLKSLVNTYVWQPVFTISGQRPVFGRFKTPMDEDGEFVLFLKKGDPSPAVAVDKTTPHPVYDKPEQRGAETTPPEIFIKTWKDKQTVFLDHIFIEGRVTDETEVVSVRINGRSILKWPGRRVYFNHMAELKEGDNPFIIESVNKAGNKARKEIHIYRKINAVHDNSARMSAALFPLEKSEALNIDIEGRLFDNLFACDRFNMKQWRGDLPVKTVYSEDDLSRAAEKQGVDFYITGKAKTWDNALELRLRVIETETLDIVANADIYGEGADRNTIDRMCRGLLCKIEHALPVVEGKIAGIKGKRLIVNLGKKQGIRKGMHLVFFEKNETISDPETGEVLGVDTRSLGTARINKVLARMSHATILEKSEPPEALQVGFPVITK